MQSQTKIMITDALDRNDLLDKLDDIDKETPSGIFTQSTQQYTQQSQAPETVFESTANEENRSHERERGALGVSPIKKTGRETSNLETEEPEGAMLETHFVDVQSQSGANTSTGDMAEINMNIDDFHEQSDANTSMADTEIHLSAAPHEPSEASTEFYY